MRAYLQELGWLRGRARIDDLAGHRVFPEDPAAKFFATLKVVGQIHHREVVLPTAHAVVHRAEKERLLRQRRHVIPNESNLHVGEACLQVRDAFPDRRRAWRLRLDHHQLGTACLDFPTVSLPVPPLGNAVEPDHVMTDLLEEGRRQRRQHREDDGGIVPHEGVEKPGDTTTLALTCREDLVLAILR